MAELPPTTASLWAAAPEHGEGFGRGLYPVPRSHVEHFFEPVGASRRVAADGAKAVDERKRMHAHRRWRNSHQPQRPCGPQRLNMGKDSVVAFTPCRAATSSISLSR